MTLYALKPAFQARLRPLVGRLAAAGVTANQVTVTAAAGSVAAGGIVALGMASRAVFLILPVWLFLRMALNAIDGMLAREFGQKSRLGAYLNEIGDVVSDSALTAPFALLAVFGVGWVGLVVLLAVLTEFTGVLGPAVGARRRYDGPLGKSDRALVFGAIGLWIGVGGPLPAWFGWIFPVLAVLLAATCFNRVRAGLAEAG